VTFSDRVFHRRAAATVKARSPMVERRRPYVRRTTSDVSMQSGNADEPLQQMTDKFLSTYGGAVWCRLGICIVHTMNSQLILLDALWPVASFQ